jgi:hypothetical protein
VLCVINNEKRVFLQGFCAGIDHGEPMEDLVPRMELVPARPFQVAAVKITHNHHWVELGQC